MGRHPTRGICRRPHKSNPLYCGGPTWAWKSKKFGAAWARIDGPPRLQSGSYAAALFCFFFVRLSKRVGNGRPSAISSGAYRKGVSNHNNSASRAALRSVVGELLACRHGPAKMLAAGESLLMPSARAVPPRAVRESRSRPDSSSGRCEGRATPLPPRGTAFGGDWNRIPW